MCLPIPANEEERLTALRRYALLDTPPDAPFDRLASLAARLFDVPLAFITLIDRDRQWFKSCQGPVSASVPARETCRDISFCAHTILSPKLLVIEDTRQDPRFADNPFVTGEPNVRFYAGAPLLDSEGHALGALCVLDFHPRALSAEQRADLTDLAAAVVSEMDLRRALADLTESHRSRRQMFLSSPHPMWVFDIETLRFLDVNETALAHYGYSRAEFLAMTLDDIRPPEDVPSLRAARPGFGLRPAGKSLWRHRKKDGGLIWAEITAHTTEYEGRAARMVVVSDVTERQQAVETLRRSEQRLSLHVRQTPLACIEWSLDAEVTAWNPAAERIFGYSRCEALGRPMLPLLVPEPAQPQVAEVVAGLRADSGGRRSTNENLTKDGRTILCEWYNTPLVDEDGQVIGVASLAQDVTEQVQAEAALRESEGKYRLLADSMEDIVSLHDGDRCVYISPSIQMVTGFTVAEALAQDSAERIHPDDLALMRVRSEMFWRDGGAPLLEMRLRTKDGGFVWTETSAGFIPNPAGGLPRVLCVTRDISERRTMEDALRGARERLDLALLAGRMGLWDLDLSTGRITGSGGYARLLGLTSEGFGHTFEDFLGCVHPEDRDWVARLGADADADRRALEGEYRVVWPDGTVCWLAFKGIITRDAQGQPVRASGAVLDITERKSLEAEREALLARTEALLAEALESADHDPLTGLLNHRAFHKRLEEEAEAARQSGRSLALLLLDLDHFKFFNDAYGHLAGDDLLRQVAQALRSACRAGDTLARFGGDEFAVLMPGATASEAAQAADALRESVAQAGCRPPGYDTPIPLGLSIGAACAPHDGTGRVALLEAADARLRVARSGGDGAGPAMRLRRSLTGSLEGFSMLDALVTAVDNKDRYTRRHSEDVLGYSARIARALGLDAAAQRTVEVAALLHDVGKIGVPDAILRKPGRLTEEEFAAVKQHPLMGAAIVGAVPGFEDALDAVRHHHERWDGEGYPLGLRGEETPQTARLMAVADAFSAMTSDRPYRKGMPPNRARRLLEEGAGTQWDPACVAAFLRTGV